MQKDCEGIEKIVTNDGTIIMPEICDHSSSPESLMYKFKWDGEQYYYDIYHAIFDEQFEIMGFFAEQNDKNFKMYLRDIETDKRTHQEVVSHIENMIDEKDEKTKIFILKSISKHGYRYNYSKVIYTGAQDKVTIICHEHGEFFQSATSHLSEKCCKICRFKHSGKNRISCEKFIKEGKKLYGEQYNYDEVNNVTFNKYIKILCTIPSHGYFFYPAII